MRLVVPAFILAFLVSVSAFAEAGIDTAWELPDAVSSGEAVEGAVQIGGLDSVVDVTCWITTADGAQHSVSTAPDPENLDRWEFVVPAEMLRSFGPVQFSAEALHGMHGTDYAQSEPATRPMTYWAELDITGVAAERLIYTLGDEVYTVRYIPCCNIYGGVVEAERLPENPHEVEEGLPKTRFGDFIVLAPDGMSASTMGLNLDIQYDPEAVRAAGIEQLALFELRADNVWGEIVSYDHDPEAGTISTHCPEGGTFVLGAKP